MRDSGAFDRIVASLHEVSLDYSRWSSAAGLIDEALGIHGSSMIFADGDADEDIRVFFAWTLYRGEPHPELERLYYENFYPIDERPPRIRKAPDSRLLHMTEVYTADELKKSPAYNALRTHGLGGNGINIRLDGPRNSRITWVVHDPVDGGGWTSTQCDTVQRLLPHVRHAVTVQQTLSGAGALGTNLAGLLDGTGLGTIQLDARGRIHAANDQALPCTHISYWTMEAKCRPSHWFSVLSVCGPAPAPSEFPGFSSSRSCHVDHPFRARATLKTEKGSEML